MITFIIISILVGLVIGIFVGKKTNKSQSNIIISEKEKNSDLLYQKDIQELKVLHEKELSEQKYKFQQEEDNIRKDAVKKSKSVMLGKMWEQIVPYKPDFPFLPSDARFLGSPIDFIVFEGVSEGDITNVVFVEIKTGKSQLNNNQRHLKKAIEQGKVSWRTIKVDTIIEEEIK